MIEKMRAKATQFAQSRSGVSNHRPHPIQPAAARNSAQQPIARHAALRSAPLPRCSITSPLIVLRERRRAAFRSSRSEGASETTARLQSIRTQTSRCQRSVMRTHASPAWDEAER